MLYLDSSPNRWAAGTFVVSLVFIIVLTLAPFDFAFEDSFSLAETFNRFSHRSSIDDWIVNVLLFVPLGFSLAAWLWKKRVGKSGQFACVLLCAFSISATVEVLQVFLPSRVSASTDIYANSMGGLLGLLCFKRWGQAATFDLFVSIEKTIQRFIQQRIAALPIQNLTLVLIGYVLMLFFISNSLQRVIHLGNWTDPYFLLLGNDQAIGSPWQGYISSISIADQAASEQEIAQIFAEKALPKAQDSLIASYDLTSYRDSYADTTGRSPKLIWQGESAKSTEQNGSLVNSAQWLESEATASLINQRLRQSSQFTLSAVIATADVEQTLPAPILSLSNQTSERRNLAVAQHEDQLVLWLRTSVNNSSGTQPELSVPDVFIDTKSHHLLITYNDSILRVYVDNLQKQVSFEINSGIVLFRGLLPLEKLKNTSLVVCKVLYYFLLFVPLGILTGLILILTKRRLAYRIVLVAESVLLVPLGLELLLILRTDYELNLTTFLLSSILTATALLGVLICRKL